MMSEVYLKSLYLNMYISNSITQSYTDLIEDENPDDKLTVYYQEDILNCMLPFAEDMIPTYFTMLCLNCKYEELALSLFRLARVAARFDIVVQISAAITRHRWRMLHNAALYFAEHKFYKSMSFMDYLYKEDITYVTMYPVYISRPHTLQRMCNPKMMCLQYVLYNRCKVPVFPITIELEDMLNSWHAEEDEESLCDNIVNPESAIAYRTYGITLAKLINTHAEYIGAIDGAWEQVKQHPNTKELAKQAIQALHSAGLIHKGEL